MPSLQGLEFNFKLLSAKIKLYSDYSKEIEMSIKEIDRWAYQNRTKRDSLKYHKDAGKFPTKHPIRFHPYSLMFSKVNEPLGTLSIAEELINQKLEILHNKNEIESRYILSKNSYEDWVLLKEIFQNELAKINEMVKLLSDNIKQCEKDLFKLKYSTEPFELKTNGETGENIKNAQEISKNIEEQNIKSNAKKELPTREGKPSKYKDDLYYDEKAIEYTVWDSDGLFKELCLTIAEDKLFTRGEELPGEKIREVQIEFEEQGYKARFQSIRKILNEAKYKGTKPRL